MAGVYTERFLSVHVANTWVVYTVPPGKRAVVMAVTCAVYGAGPVTFQVYIGTTYLVNVSVPANDSRQLVQLRCAAYGGEAIGASVTSSTGNLIVAGYLFDDLVRSGPARTYEVPDTGGLPPEVTADPIRPFGDAA